MQSGISEAQKMAVDALRKFLDKELEPAFVAHGDGPIPKEKMIGWMKQLTEFGLIAAPHPEEHGGFGLDWQTHLRLYEEVVYSSMDIALPTGLNSFAAEMLIKFGNDELKKRYLPGLMKGEVMSSIGLSEPDIGSDVASVKTRAVRDGDHWVISGEKTWVSNGAYSDFLICACRTGEGEVTNILIDREEHGYEAKNIKKIALNGQSTAQIFLDGARVPVSNTMGSIGGGLKDTMMTFEVARCHMGIWGTGLARRALDEAIKYSQERIQYGKKIAGHQLIAEKLATMATEVDAARLLSHRAIELVDNGIRCDKECAMAKWYATEAAVKVARDALQIHGGNGVTKEFIVERLLREAVIAPIPDGTTEIQKLIIARDLTGISAIR